MASFNTLVPFILHWETGAQITTHDPSKAYAQASAHGFHDGDPHDRGGATMCGVTLSTYADWCRRHHRPVPTVADLARLDYATWTAIAREGFWVRCRADEIVAQGVANMLVDWCFTSGNHAIKRAQRALGLQADGVVGAKTLAALNAPDSAATFRAIKDARIAFYRSIARGTQARYLKGWLARTEATHM